MKYVANIHQPCHRRKALSQETQSLKRINPVRPEKVTFEALQYNSMPISSNANKQ